MKLLFSLFAAVVLMGNGNWYININDAKPIAQKENKCILLNFSGSDWCGPCMRMRNEVFNSDVFAEYADSNLVLVNADFPRMKKNQLKTAQQKINDATADSYNPNGIFPYTLLLDSNGKVLKAWEGFYDKGAENFTEEVKEIVDNNRKRK